MTRRIFRRPAFRTALRFLAGALLVSRLAPVPAATGGGAKLPAIGGMETVASVNGEPITLDELLRQVGAFHSGVAEATVRKPDVPALLDRIVNSRLILQESRRIGLDQLPEFKNQVESLRLGQVKNLLVSRQVEEITEGEPGAVEKLYREAVRELTIDSLLFQRQDDATAFSDAIKAGADYKALAGKAVAAGKAQGGAGGQSMKPLELRPEIARVVTAMSPGETSAPIKLNDGFTIVRLLQIRYPENPEARRQARLDALEARRQARLEAYMDVLRTRYTPVDRRLLAGLDYESKEPGLETLRKDERIVARVKGGPPVRVMDLTAGVEAKFYHGVEGAIERKRVNEDLPQILDRILLERATALEAKRLGLERTDEFKRALKGRTEGALFDSFVKKVINPEVKLDGASLKKYYDFFPIDSATPEMMEIWCGMPGERASCSAPPAAPCSSSGTE